MMMIADAVERLRDWAQPREAIHAGEKCPFLLSCRLSRNPASEEDIELVGAGPDVEAFWKISEGAELFKDETYEQWGLKIFSPTESINNSEIERLSRPDDVHDSDIVIGQFYGDSEQLVIDTASASKGEFPILVKLPIDERSEWPVVASTFSNFLEQYISAEGEKFWER